MNIGLYLRLKKHLMSYRGYGILHREDGPAIDYVDGNKAWFINGELHREDGPALENHENTIGWFLNGYKIEPTFKMMEKYINLNPDNILKDYRYPLEIQLLAIKLKPSVIFNIKHLNPKLKKLYPKQMALRNIVV